MIKYAQQTDVKKIKLNPDNPRVIKDDAYQRLVKSIQEFPEMLELRPIVIDENGVILGGNMRYKACIDAGLTKVPTVQASTLTEEQKREFVVKDNLPYGEWDWEALQGWDAELLNDWGLGTLQISEIPGEGELTNDDTSKPATLKITFVSPEQLQQCEIDVIELIDRKYNGAYYSISCGDI
jgi:ParB-like chromosome segregation protein Spo0J